MIRDFTPVENYFRIHLLIEPGIAMPDLFTALRQNLSYFVSSGLVVDDLRDSGDSVLRDPKFDDRRFFSYSLVPSRGNEQQGSCLIGHYLEDVSKGGAIVGFFGTPTLNTIAERGLKELKLRFSIGNLRFYKRKFARDDETTQRYVSAYKDFLNYMTSRETRPQVFFTDFRLPEGVEVMTRLPDANYDHVLRALHRKVDPLITYPFVILGPYFDLDTREPRSDRVDVTICTSDRGNHSGVLPDLEKVVAYLTDKERFKTDELTGKTMGRTAVVFLPSPYDLSPYEEQLMEGLKEKRHIIRLPADFT